jgi:hypothetical protein
MSLIAEAKFSSPFSQIQQFCSAIGLFFSTLCERTDSAFRRVHVVKRGEDGCIKFYDIKNEQTGKTRKTPVLPYIEDIKTGEIQRDEPAYIIATKCALIALGIPFYTMGKMAWSYFKTPFEISALAINTLASAGERLLLGNLYESAVEMLRGFSQLPSVLGRALFDIVTAPLFALGIKLAGIYGIIRPYHGRKIEALIEFTWQRGVRCQEDFRKIPEREGENCLQAFVKDIQSFPPFYFAYCFQSRGNVNDPNILVVSREPL